MGMLTAWRTKAAQLLSPASSAGGWYGVVRESFTGAWQRNVEIDSRETILAFSAVYACVTRIANDIGKLPIKLVEEDDVGIWTLAAWGSPYWPVLRKPNGYQNRIQFFTSWMVSKLLHGNAYALKQRDQRGIVTALFILDPRRVRVLVTDDGGVYYELGQDNLSQVTGEVVVPASEILHDRMNPMFHPLVGISPIYACGAAATQGNRIQANSARFFENMSRPAGVLTAPGKIPDELSKRLKDHWDNNYTGINAGKIAVLGDGLKYESMTMPANDAQLIEQLKWTSEDVARAFGVPLYKINAGPVPISNNVEALGQQYFSDCLQVHIESIELCLDEGLGLTQINGKQYGSEFDLDVLLRMDSATALESLAKAVGAGIMAPNEARQKRNLPPVAGGQTPYLQMQNWSLAQLNRRDIVTDSPAAAAPPPPKPADEESNPEAAAKFFDIVLRTLDTELIHHA